jgi:dTMP kinase
VYEYERLINDDDRPPLVLEDRGVDTVAVYQAAIMTLDRCEPAIARIDQVHATAALWRPPPALTLLLVDDVDTCIARFEARLGAPISCADRHLIHRVAELYHHLADTHADRVRIVDRRGRHEDDVLAELHAHCSAVQKEVRVP